ncbi:MAG: NHLP bacteriocin system secretion protein, partial [Rhodocyclaceae bacterium]|nr:NHLP bacteriocin system secretion protein [Rhodocyclaceae bacterium]
MSDKQVKSSIFRKAALDRLSSPEALDALMQVITPRAWLLLVPLLAITIFAVAWSVLGTLPDKVESRNCILLNTTGLSSVVADTAGRLVALEVKVGDRVAVGDTLARVALPEMEESLRKSEGRLKELEARIEVIERYGADSNNLSDRTVEQKRQLLAGQIASTRQRIANARDRVTALEERVRVQGDLFQRGLVTNNQLVATRQDLAAAKQEEVAEQLQLESLQGQFDQLRLNAMERRRSVGVQREEIAAQMSEARRERDGLRARMDKAAVVRSAYAGRVVEVSASLGALVSPGLPLATVELDSSETAPAGAAIPLEAVVFPGLADGRKIGADMVARIVPSTAKRQEFGYITGRVSSVADYPSTPRGVMRILQNENLARALASGEPPLVVRVRLDTADTPSGFQWSASQGPARRVGSGTLCSA